MNYRQIIRIGTSILKDNFIKTASIDAEILLSKSLNLSRDKILLNLENQINPEETESFIKLIDRRKKKEPISHITKQKYFWNNEFYVNKNVLTPRFETELLVEETLKLHKHFEKINVLDIGTGSGCILISLLREKIQWRGTGIDISGLALKTAKINAKMQQVANRIKFINSDIDNFNYCKYDLIVSNPPYLNKIGYNNLDLDVKSYEPKKALYGGLDGLRVIEKVIYKSKFILKNNGFLALEIGHDQYFKVKKILIDHGFYIFKTIKDYQKFKRCFIAIKFDN
tara:strand:+ start:456 stop:1304 length:849 start_codon:yes stop_codon:yes gene_type:complete